MKKMMVSNIMSAAGANNKVARIIASGLDIIGGIAGGKIYVGTRAAQIAKHQDLVGVAIGGIAGFLGGAGAKNAKAVNNAKGVNDATAHYNKIAAKIANGNKSRSIAHATKLLDAAIKDQKALMFYVAMLWSGISTSSSTVAYMLGNENDSWPF